jgi:hypothetical protein
MLIAAHRLGGDMSNFWPSVICFSNIKTSTAAKTEQKTAG